MVKATIRFQFQKMGGAVAIVAFDDRRYMKFGFANSQNTVVAFAAIAKHFAVINAGDSGKPEECMTGRACVTGGNVIQRLTRNRDKFIVMTIHAI